MLSAKISEKSISKMKHVKLLAVFLIPVVALILGTTASESWAAPLEEFEVLIEINATDGDAGFQALVDGEPWQLLDIEAPDGTILEVDASSGNLKVTELVFEGEEPDLDERTLGDLMEQFPEGNYRAQAENLEDETILTGIARLTHVLPCGPEIDEITENGDGDVTVIWVPVTRVIDPDATDAAGEIVCEVDPSPSLRMIGYQFVAEQGDRVYSVDLPADATEWTVPADFFRGDRDRKIEILGTERGGNRTATEEEL